MAVGILTLATKRPPTTLGDPSQRRAMTVIITGSSALEYLRAKPPTIWPAPRFEEPFNLASNPTDFRQAAKLDASSLGLARRPIHVLVPRGHYHSNSHNIRTHELMLNPIPGDLLLEVAPDVLVCGPELTYFQTSPRRSLVGDVVLGCELTGEYSHFSQLVSGYYERPPLTSIESLVCASERLSGLFGIKSATKNLEWVCECSRSPMETVLATELCLPTQVGGEGFAKPTLNYEVPLDDAAKAITHTKTSYVDIAWPDAMVGVEYDSDEWHTDKDKDRRRAEALQHMGWDIYTVHLDQMHKVSELEKTVALLRGHAPQLEEAEEPSRTLRRQLHEKLLRATRFGIGMSAALFPPSVNARGIKLHI